MTAFCQLGGAYHYEVREREEITAY